MKQILQNLSNGETSLVEVPVPKNIPESILVASSKSLISAGTEKMLIDFGKANYFAKALKEPKRVLDVLDKIKTDGILTTYDAVRSKLDQPIPLGYSNSGVVIESNVSGFSKGDRVISNGNHAEIVRVPKNLCAKIPNEVDDETAAFTVIGAIGLQGVRLANPSIGETFAVFGLGLVGLMTIQILSANGCRVIGIDYDSKRCDIAEKLGIRAINLSIEDDPIPATYAFTNDIGVDGVLITASTESNELIHQAALMCRKKGRIILVGQTGLNINRDDFFEKELTFQVSASYGPGRYDPSYEEKGNDYPLAYVRWTEKRNFEAVLEMMKNGSIDIGSLITHRYDIEEGLLAYKALEEKSSLAIVLNYDSKNYSSHSSKVLLKSNEERIKPKEAPVVAFIGAGNYASRTLIPAFKKTEAILDTIYSSGGITGFHHGKRWGFLSTSTDIDEIWDKKDLNTIVIATKHDSHAELVCKGIDSGKNIFVEKPLCLTIEELEKIEKSYNRSVKEKSIEPKIMVGFNRRFAPHILKMKSLLESKDQQKSIIMTINAGFIPEDHWVNEPKVGGGRIIAEGCHFIDLMSFLSGKSIVDFNAVAIKNHDKSTGLNDNISISLLMSDGSIGTINYLSNGPNSYPKERVEVFCDGSALQMNNYLDLRGFNWKGFKKLRSFKQDKGQSGCSKSFVDSIINGKSSPIPFEELLRSSKIAIEISDSLK